MNYIIITSNPLDGFNFVGSFVDITSALNFARREYGDDNWWVKDLIVPEENTSRPDSVPKSSIWQLTLSAYMKDKKIVYKDGNCRNYNINNLELVPINKVPEINTSLDRMAYEDLPDIHSDIDDEQDFADRESYASSLPGIEDYHRMDGVSEEDLPL